MIDREKCCGCGACANICPKQVITMTADELGFLYPVINTELCINCNLCEDVCPGLSLERYKNDKCFNKAYAGYLESNDELLKSASGGVFVAIANKYLEIGATICGVQYSSDFRKSYFTTINNESELQKLRGSKYIQSEKRDIYKRVKALLEDKKEVFFTGLPCDVVALKCYLKKEYDNLTTVDLICYGCTTPMVAEKYLDKMEKKFKSKAVHFTVKDKKSGWENTSLYIKFENGKEYRNLFRNTEYGVAFDKLVRESCYTCDFKGDNRASDLTIGDYWGIKKEDVMYNQNGVSVIFAHTDKGVGIIEKLKGFNIQEIDLKYARSANVSIDKSQTNYELSMKFKQSFLNYGIDKATHDFKFVLRSMLPTKVIECLKHIRYKL